MDQVRSDVLAHAEVGTALLDQRDAPLADALVRLVGQTSSARLLARAGAAGVARMPTDELAAVARVSMRVADRVAAARVFGDLVAREQRPRCSGANAVLAALPPGFARLETEMLLGIVLSASMTVRAVVVLAKGGDVGTSVTLRDVLAPMLRFRAVGFVLVHNHPSGNPEPSIDDIELTERVAVAALTVGTALLDHVIVAHDGMVSLVDEGLFRPRLSNDR